MYTKKENIRLKDIAENLGLSIGTVQRALNNKGGYSKETQERIIEEAKKLGYITNPAASALRRTPTVIGVVLPHQNGDRRFFFNDIWKGIQQAEAELAIQNVHLFKFETEYGKEQFENLMKIPKLRGVITHAFPEPEINKLLEEFRGKSIPVFSVDGDCDKNRETCGYTLLTQNQGSLAADIFRNIIGTRSGTILLLAGNKKKERQQLRSLEFCSAIAEYSNSINVLEFYLSENKNETAKMVRKALDTFDNILGIYAVSAIETMIMCRILKESGLSGKITAIGTDVFPELLQYYKDGTLTASTFQNPIQQGYLAVKMMAQSIISPSDKESVYTIPASAVFRSTAPDFCR